MAWKRAKSRKGRPPHPITEAQQQVIARGLRPVLRSPAQDPGNAERIRVRRARTLELRIAGYSYREIMAQLRIEGFTVSHPTVCQDLKKALARLDEKQYRDAARLKTLELLRLDAQTRALWDDKGQSENSNALIRIADRRAKLAGLDKPIAIASLGPDFESVLGRLPDDLIEQIAAHLDRDDAE